MDDFGWMLILLLFLFACIILSFFFLLKKSKEQAQQSEVNITRMVNSLPQDKQMPFLMQLNSVKKNPTTAVLLALFLGGLGAHKFYLGQTVMGIIYILFAWTTIPSWIALIEAFTLSGKTAQFNEKKAQEYIQMYSNYSKR